MFPKTDGHDRQTLDFAAVRRRDGRYGRASACRSQERFRQVRDIRRAGNRD